ncbi:MAG TPA: NlpC/P60 family protein [Candidatus Cloacimonadota bacterium]|nr:NlpC/P60 family protein [Candidatus Cloacimonadota bacterium]
MTKSDQPHSQILSQYFERAKEWALNFLESKEYNTRCLAFVEDAYEIPNHIEIFGGDTATESAQEYNASHTEEEPLIGAFVFYSCSGMLHDQYKDWGHVGLYLGEGKVIHAWDKVRIDPLKDMENLSVPPGWTKLVYLGWAPQERIFEGYRIK